MSQVWWSWQEFHSKLKIDTTSDYERFAAFWVFWTDGCQHLCDKTIRLEDIAHLGDQAGKGIHKREEIRLKDLGAMAVTVADRMDLYGYQP
jgi:hypothetical protein